MLKDPQDLRQIVHVGALPRTLDVGVASGGGRVEIEAIRPDHGVIREFDRRNLGERAKVVARLVALDMSGLGAPAGDRARRDHGVGAVHPDETAERSHE